MISSRCLIRSCHATPPIFAAIRHISWLLRRCYHYTLSLRLLRHLRDMLTLRQLLKIFLAAADMAYVLRVAATRFFADALCRY